jgi:hypothetical protein
MLAQGLLFDPRMSKQAARIRDTWPLYLVIALAGAASIATTLPSWSESRQFGGPRVTLGPDLREEVVPFTVRFSPKHTMSDIFVFGTVDYEGADEELRISLVEPDQRTLATQFHTIQGDGRLLFWVDALGVSLRCASPETETCEQELAVVFGTSGTRAGAYDIDWSLRLEMGGPDAEPPADPVLDVDFPRGRVVEFTPDPLPLGIAPDAIGDDRWRVVDTRGAGFYFDPASTSHSMHVTLIGTGPYTASQLYVPLGLSYYESALQGEATFRIAVIPDEPAGGAVVEHVATVSGAGTLQAALSIPEPLDCVDELVCERGFTITLDIEAEILGSVYMSLSIQAAIDGDGEAPPPGARVTLSETPASAQPQDD